MYARGLLSDCVEPMGDALALLEMDSVAGGLSALDTLVKHAAVRVLEANLVEPGKFLILFEGGVAEVEACHTVVLEKYRHEIISEMMLPMVHEALLAGLRGVMSYDKPDTLGVVEGSDVATTLRAADRSLKDASIRLCGIRVCLGLAGRAYFVVSGLQHDVEAGVAVGCDVLNADGRLHRSEVIARPHDEMVAWLLRPAPFQLG